MTELRRRFLFERERPTAAAQMSAARASFPRNESTLERKEMSLSSSRFRDHLQLVVVLSHSHCRVARAINVGIYNRRNAGACVRVVAIKHEDPLGYKLVETSDNSRRGRK